MTTLLTDSYFFSFFIDYMVIFIFCLVGAFIKDAYNSFVGTEEKVVLIRIFISATVASAVILPFSERIITAIGWRGMYLLCFIGGMLGFDSMSKIQSFDFWVNILKNRKKIFDIISQLKLSDSNNSSDSKDKNENKDDDGS